MPSRFWRMHEVAISRMNRRPEITSGVPRERSIPGIGDTRDSVRFRQSSLRANPADHDAPYL